MKRKIYGQGNRTMVFIFVEKIGIIMQFVFIPNSGD